MLKRTAAATIACLLLFPIAIFAGGLRAGAAAVDITPLRLPVSMTGGFQDRLADVRVYRRALKSAEIKAAAKR